jgi:glycine cleavage system regulatory protein
MNMITALKVLTPKWGMAGLVVLMACHMLTVAEERMVVAAQVVAAVRAGLLVQFVLFGPAHHVNFQHNLQVTCNEPLH